MRADLMRLPMPFGETLDAQTSWRVHSRRKHARIPPSWVPAHKSGKQSQRSLPAQHVAAASATSPAAWHGSIRPLSVSPLQPYQYRQNRGIQSHQSAFPVQWYHDFKLLRTSWDFSIHCLAASGALQLPRPVTHELSKHLSRSGRRPFLLPSRSSRALCQKPSVAALRASLP